MNYTEILVSNNPDLNGIECPFPLSIIPNHMGINLCSVESVSWTKQNDGQLVDISIKFIPDPKES